MEHARNTRHLVENTIKKSIDNIYINLEKLLNNPLKKKKTISEYLGKISSPTTIETPKIKIESYNSNYCIDFWKISFELECKNCIKESFIADFNFNSNGGPKIKIKEGMLLINIGNSIYDNVTEYMLNKIDQNIRYSLVIERKGYHIFISLKEKDSGKILNEIKEVNIFYPLLFKDIRFCIDFDGIVENLYISYF